MEQDYREYVAYVGNERYEYYIEKGLVPESDIEWFNFIDDNAVTDNERILVRNSEHIRIYAISPSIGDGLLISEFDTDSVLKDKSNTGENTKEGIKLDKDKPIVGDLLRVFSNTLLRIGDCMTYNAKHHPEPDDWKNLDNAQRRLTNAMIRHLLKYMTGKELDEDDNIPHLVHVAWNALAVCELYLTRKDK